MVDLGNSSFWRDRTVVLSTRTSSLIEMDDTIACQTHHLTWDKVPDWRLNEIVMKSLMEEGL